MKISVWPSVEEVASSFKGILLDAYGVFWGGGIGPLLPGAKEAMKKLVDAGKIVGILSNTTQMAEREIEKVKRHGILQGEHFHFFLTSGELAHQIFVKEKLPFPTPKKKFWMFGKQHPRFAPYQQIFAGSSYEETNALSDADFIYVYIPHIQGEDQTMVSPFEEELRLIVQSGLPMVCPNPDKFAHEGNPPRLVVRQGSIASAFQERGGKVFYIGKPELVAYQAAMERFSVHRIGSPQEVLMVGDTPETDILGAKRAGMASALVLHTGIMAERIRKREVGDLLHLFAPEELPDFFIERLGKYDV